MQKLFRVADVFYVDMTDPEKPGTISAMDSEFMPDIGDIVRLNRTSNPEKDKKPFKVSNIEYIINVDTRTYTGQVYLESIDDILDKIPKTEPEKVPTQPDSPAKPEMPGGTDGMGDIDGEHREEPV